MRLCGFFCDTQKKNPDYFLLLWITALTLSFCLSANADNSQDIMIHLKPLRLSHSRRDRYTVNGEDSRTPPTFSFGAKPGFGTDSRKSASRLAPPKARDAGDGSVRCADTLTSAACPRGEKLSPSMIPLRSVRWKQQGRTVETSILSS